MPRLVLVPDSVAHSASGPPPFLCTWTNGGVDAAWVNVAGELDVATTPTLERSLRAAQSQARLVVLDLRKLAFMDSAGAHAIVGASTRARELGSQLVLLRAQPNVDRMFALIGRADHVEVLDIDALEPPVQALLKLAAGESGLAS